MINNLVLLTACTSFIIHVTVYNFWKYVRSYGTNESIEYGVKNYMYYRSCGNSSCSICINLDCMALKRDHLKLWKSYFPGLHSILFFFSIRSDILRCYIEKLHVKLFFWIQMVIKAKNCYLNMVNKNDQLHPVPVFSYSAGSSSWSTPPICDLYLCIKFGCCISICAFFDFL